MLALERKPEMAIWIGPHIRVKVLRVAGKNVRLGIEAPRHLSIWREELAVRPAAPATRDAADPALRVLVVEDDPLHARMISKALRDGSTQHIDIVSTGSAALDRLQPRDEALSSAGPDLVLLDLNLPDMSGLEVLKRIRSSKQTLPTVVLSASSRDADVSLSLKHGANAFVPKAVGYQQFRTAIVSIAEFWRHARIAG